MAEFAGRVALVTGGAGGIGGAVVELLLSRGATTISADIANEPGIRASGRRLEVALDAASPASVRSAVGLVAERQPTIDILINCAGVFRTASLSASTDDFLVEMVSHNLLSAFYVSREVLPRMNKNGRAAIVNVASGAAFAGYGSLTAYSASKAGIVGFTRALAMELAPAVRVNAVAPGATDTAPVRAQAQEAVEGMIRRIPLGRLADASDVAEAILFLCADRARHITGETLMINGGGIMR